MHKRVKVSPNYIAQSAAIFDLHPDLGFQGYSSMQIESPHYMAPTMLFICVKMKSINKFSLSRAREREHLSIMG